MRGHLRGNERDGWRRRDGWEMASRVFAVECNANGNGGLMAFVRLYSIGKVCVLYPAFSCRSITQLGVLPSRRQMPRSLSSFVQVVIRAGLVCHLSFGLGLTQRQVPLSSPLLLLSPFTPRQVVVPPSLRWPWIPCYVRLRSTLTDDDHTPTQCLFRLAVPPLAGRPLPSSLSPSPPPSFFRSSLPPRPFRLSDKHELLSRPNRSSGEQHRTSDPPDRSSDSASAATSSRSRTVAATPRTLPSAPRCRSPQAQSTRSGPSGTTSSLSGLVRVTPRRSERASTPASCERPTPRRNAPSSRRRNRNRNNTLSTLLVAQLVCRRSSSTRRSARSRSAPLSKPPSRSRLLRPAPHRSAPSSVASWTACVGSSQPARPRPTRVEAPSSRPTFTA